MEYSDPKWHWNAPFAIPEVKKIPGEVPQNPLEEYVSLRVHIKYMCILVHYPPWHYALSEFDPRNQV